MKGEEVPEDPVFDEAPPSVKLVALVVNGVRR